MKNLKKILLLVLALAMVLCFCACAADSESPEETTTAPDATSGSISANGGFAERPTEDNSNKIEYVITVKDTDGNAVVGAMVQICKDTCLPGTTNADGVATFTVTETGHKVSFLTLPSGYAYVDEDITEWYFEDGSYEMTIVLQVALEDSSN